MGRNRLLDHPCPCTRGLPLMSRASLYGQLPVLQYLAEKEGKKYFIEKLRDCREHDTYTALSALHAAAVGGKLNIVKWFCEQGVSADFVLPKTKDTPLHFACKTKVEEGAEIMQLSVVKYLIEDQHADWRLKTDTGRTATDLAREAGNTLIEAYLRGLEQKQAKKDRQANGKTEEELRLAAAAADQAAAAFLAELDAEDAAATASKAKAMKASPARKRKRFKEGVGRRINRIKEKKK